MSSLNEQFGTKSSSISITVDGERVDVELKRLTLGALAEFERWCQDVIIDRAKRLASSLPDDGRKHVLSEAMRELSSANWGSPAVESMLSSPLGVGKLVHILMPIDVQRKFTPGKVTEGLDLSDLGKVMEALFNTAGIGAKAAEGVAAAAASLRAEDPTEPASPRRTGVS